MRGSRQAGAQDTKRENQAQLEAKLQGNRSPDPQFVPGVGEHGRCHQSDKNQEPNKPQEAEEAEDWMGWLGELNLKTATHTTRLGTEIHRQHSSQSLQQVTHPKNPCLKSRRESRPASAAFPEYARL